MIKTVDLTKVFRTDEIETSALNKVDIHVKRGEFVAIMGPSGCGKSTLLNIIGLLDNPNGGEYYFDEKPVAQLKERNRTLLRKGNIGFVFQSFNLIDELSVYENVELPLIYLKLKARERKEMVEKVLERMKISHRKKHFPQQLSGGRKLKYISFFCVSFKCFHRTAQTSRTISSLYKGNPRTPTQAVCT